MLPRATVPDPFSEPMESVPCIADRSIDPELAIDAVVASADPANDIAPAVLLVMLAVPAVEASANVRAPELAIVAAPAVV